MSALAFAPRGAVLIEAQEDPMRGMCSLRGGHLKKVLKKKRKMDWPQNAQKAQEGKLVGGGPGRYSLG
jgi:hypothetical protein